MKKIITAGIVASLSIVLISMNSCSKSSKEVAQEKIVTNTPAAPTAAVVAKPVTEATSSSNLTYEGKVVEITSDEHFAEVIKRSNSKLTMFDLYADWCGPCKKLSPMLEKMAPTVAEQVEVYKVNVDKLPNISRSFNVKSIPLVVFIKEEKGVDDIVGLRSEKDYRAIIEKHAFKK